MRLTKPAWVMHQDGTRSENAKRLSIFSVHVHPDGSRIATGGLDAKVRIWSTKPILNSAAEQANKPPKSLCTLTMHTGPVLTVRWAHSGRWLASGSDDEIIMIWDLDPTGAGKVWGSDEINVEGWKPLKRLPGHESDVTDLAWSPDDRYLASTGLDSKVLIWCGYTLERLAKLDLHQGFVKGVCWDPVGEFLATQSDDRTVRIWRTFDWGLEATVTRPFEHSPGSTFFRRLSWSPDGAHITASNATNNNGFVFTAAVITRNTWTSDISLVGHENTVEVAAYNPHIFLRDPSVPCSTANICSVVALGADDQALSVWQTKSARPLVVASHVFERQIMDLCWSTDGLTLYAVSSDGTLAVLAFDEMELEGRASKDAEKQYLSKFGFVPPPIPNGYAHAMGINGTSGPVNGINGSGISRSRTSTPPTTIAHQNGFGHGTPGATGEQITTLVARRAPRDRDADRNRRRLHPTNVPFGSASASAPPPANNNSINSAAPISMTASVSIPPAFGVSTSNSSDIGMYMDLDSETSFGASLGVSSGSGGGMDMAVPINAIDTRGRRGKALDGYPVSVSVSGLGVYTDDGGKPPKARTLGGDRIRSAESVEKDVREIKREGNGMWTGSVGSGLEGPSNSRAEVLPSPSLKTFLEARVEETGDVLEARNSENRYEPSEVSFYASKEKSVQWLDYLSSPVLAICASSRFCAVAMEDGAVNVYSYTGRRIMPTLTLGSRVAFLDAAKYHLLAVTTCGQVFVWNTKTSSAVHHPTSILAQLAPSPPSPTNPNGIVPSIISASIRPNGAPLVHLNTGIALSYDVALASWVRVGDVWWASGSTCWKGKQRASATTSATAGGIVASIEARVVEYTSSEAAEEAKRPSWWAAALTLGHLEARMHAARVLGSAPEYRQALLLYAKAIADEGFRGKAEEVLRELYGPVYCEIIHVARRPGKLDDAWLPSVLGMAKRDLAKEVLTIFGRSKTLLKLAQDYQELLRKASVDD
ncbi:hypothetical protein EW145_g2454 [Phellinidium pouzarii]|uniref:Protein HIR n=1 Tax=Phellinidium pouzarii TaxID=167371 RepID=A0A4V3XD90_9AGAM|nr:hypothetical protein EW145_g2454 [Phellinidium pouzarii]